MIEIKEATVSLEFEIIKNLASEILHEVYDPIIPSTHTDIFLQENLSVKAITNQTELKNFSYYLLNFHSKTVGFLGLQKLSNKIILNKLYVLASFRGNKIGKTALEFVTNLALKNNSTSIELIVNQKNNHSISIYKKNGFKIIESLVNSFPNGYTVEDYKMQKKLHHNQHSS